MTSPIRTRRAARRTAAAERAEESRARKLQRRLAEARALSPLATDKPEIANAPVEKLWPRRRALLIINSKSGPNHDSILQLRDLVDRLATFGIRADVRVKLRKSQARKQARVAAVRKRYPLVIAAGGDGTVESVASGLVGTQATLGIIPLGTYNNVATCLGIPTDVEQACALIACGAERRIDVGVVVARHMKRPRIFLELSTVGLGAALGPLGQHVEKGRWDQAAQALPKVMDMSPGPTQVLLDDEGQSRTSNTLLVTVSNSPRAGAGLPLAPSARMDDGLLDVCIYEDLNQAGVLARFLPGPVGGTSSAADESVVRARARTVEIRTARPMPVSIESKLVGVTPARFSVLTGALSVIAGDGDGLLHPASTELVRASASAAHTLAPAPHEADSGGTPRQLVEQSSAGLLQALVPAAGRALDTVTAARPIALPLLTGAIGLAAAAMLRPRRKRLFR
jgi:diacylglycerol kinase (ATP)